MRDRKNSKPLKSSKASKQLKKVFQKTEVAKKEQKQSAPLHRQQHNLLFGTHAVDAALENPNRVLKKLYVTPTRQADYETYSSKVKIQTVSKEEMDKLLPNGATHQGVALSAILKDISSEHDFTKSQNPVIMLDGLSDPQNIGSILRSCAAFGVQHVIMQEKGTPEITGTLAKAAAGAVEYVQLHKVTNLVRTLESLKSAEFMVYGADGHSDHVLNDISFPTKTVIVVGSEGNGIRRLVKNNCDMLFKIPMSPVMESLNVANAFAITLYAVTQNTIWTS